MQDSATRFIKAAQSMRDTYTFSNSAIAIARFPYPWQEDTFAYSVNVVDHPSSDSNSVFKHNFDIDEHYLSEIEEKNLALQYEHATFKSQPYMDLAQWDALELIMSSLAKDYPQYFELKTKGNVWCWKNIPLDIDVEFEFGNLSSLPCLPADFIFKQAQGDFVIMDQRDNTLYADAGLVTGPANWSFANIFGETFNAIHVPVPVANEAGIFDRALKLLLNLSSPMRRLNWSLTVHPRLDTAIETQHLWLAERDQVNQDNAGELVNLRIELQTFYRLPRSHCILFSIRTYLCSFAELAKYDAALIVRAYKVLHDLPQELIEYKGMSSYYKDLLAWLDKNKKKAEK